MLVNPGATLYSSVSTVLSRSVFGDEGPTGETKLMKMAQELLFDCQKEKTHRYVHAVFKCLKNFISNRVMRDNRVQCEEVFMIRRCKYGVWGPRKHWMLN